MKSHSGRSRGFLIQGLFFSNAHIPKQSAMRMMTICSW